jgi:hypothetical protein
MAKLRGVTIELTVHSDEGKEEFERKVLTGKETEKIERGRLSKVVRDNLHIWIDEVVGRMLRKAGV